MHDLFQRPVHGGKIADQPVQHRRNCIKAAFDLEFVKPLQQTDLHGVGTMFENHIVFLPRRL